MRIRGGSSRFAMKPACGQMSIETSTSSCGKWEAHLKKKLDHVTACCIWVLTRNVPVFKSTIQA
jgi:hypothetical protein